MIVRLALNSSEKVILCTGDTAATYKLLDISLEYDAIFEKHYATTIGGLYAGTNSIQGHINPSPDTVEKGHYLRNRR